MQKLTLNATAKVTLTKLDENGNVVGVEQHEVKLTEKEAEALCHLQQQE